ncbi:hypothetical protein AB0442_28650, partial [Kitasatospora sp. NPDC085895]
MTFVPRPDAPADIHRRIADRLAKLADTPRGVPPHPYIRRHLAQHADLGGVLGDAHLPAPFLPWDLDSRLRGRLGLPITPQPGQETLAAWAGIEPFLGDADHRTREASLQFTLATTGADPDDGVIVRARLSRWHTANNVLAAHISASCIAAFTGPDGRPLLATGGDDRTVRVWDPLTGVQVGEPLGHDGAVHAVVAFDGPDNRPLLATGSDDHTARVWDPLTGTQVGEPLRGHDRRVNAAAVFAGLDGRPLLATGSDDRTVRVWDPLTGTQVGEPLRGHDRRVNAAAVFAGLD